MDKKRFKNLRVLVMGLGLHGGGVETARYLIRAGARVTCTDLRHETILAPSIAQLDGLGIRFVLGKHQEKDFDDADLIIKNPAVPADSPWLLGRSSIETDISLFLRSCRSPLIAVSGSKGKSSVVSALHPLLKTRYPRVKLGGNIGISPLSFLDELHPKDPVILELSSWQLADLRHKELLRPRLACITNLMSDHQDRYASFADYEADKRVIFRNLAPDAISIFPDKPYGRRWAKSLKNKSFFVREDSPQNSDYQGAWIDKNQCGWINKGQRAEMIVPKKLCVPGLPFRLNLLFAATIARFFGIEAPIIHQTLKNFRGVPHRMEFFLEKNGVRYYNDTAATIPEATLAAVHSLDCPVVLIAGGNDKKLDSSPLKKILPQTRRIILLAGTASESWLPHLRTAGAFLEGPFNSMQACVAAAEAVAQKGDAILLSPGATSFGLFQHEFERGEVFKKACRS